MTRTKACQLGPRGRRQNHRCGTSLRRTAAASTTVAFSAKARRVGVCGQRREGRGARTAQWTRSDVTLSRQDQLLDNFKKSVLTKALDHVGLQNAVLKHVAEPHWVRACSSWSQMLGVPLCTRIRNSLRKQETHRSVTPASHTIQCAGPPRES